MAKRKPPTRPRKLRAKYAARQGRKEGRDYTRRAVNLATGERDYSDEETKFLKAMERYKRESKRPFPLLSEVLAVVRSLGYRRVAEPGPLPKAKGE